jgi:hypothetical protein
VFSLRGQGVKRSTEFKKEKKRVFADQASKRSFKVVFHSVTLSKKFQSGFNTENLEKERFKEVSKKKDGRVMEFKVVLKKIPG